MHNRDVPRKGLRAYSMSSRQAFNTGKLMLCAHCQMWQYCPVSCAWTDGYFENIHLHSIKQPHCPVCKASKQSFGEQNSSSWQLSDYRLFLQNLILTTLADKMAKGEARQNLEDEAVRTSEGIISSMKCISRTTLIVSNIVHTVHLGTVQNSMNVVTSFLEQHSRIDKVNQLWVMIPPYRGFS